MVWKNTRRGDRAGLLATLSPEVATVVLVVRVPDGRPFSVVKLTRRGVVFSCFCSVEEGVTGMITGVAVGETTIQPSSNFGFFSTDFTKSVSRFWPPDTFGV